MFFLPESGSGRKSCKSLERFLQENDFFLQLSSKTTFIQCAFPWKSLIEKKFLATDISSKLPFCRVTSEALTIN